KESVSSHLKLKGKWNASKITNDLFIMLFVLIGGCWMLYERFKTAMTEPVYHQG
nr:6K2 [Cucurbit vein banding virus]